MNIGAFSFGNAVAAWIAGAAIDAGLGYPSVNIVGVAMTTLALILALVSIVLTRRERRVRAFELVS